MSNAVKFTAAGEIELKIELQEHEKVASDKTTIRFSVRDTGIGINPQNQQKIFEAFSQEDASTSRKYGGTGLGLAISKKLLQLMGSELQLQSIPGEGSTFFFNLEVKTMHGNADQLPLLSSFKNILIVDDNANNRLLLKDMLASQHMQCDEAENGFVAIDILRRGKKYDFILMDFNMPGMDGIETIKKIREDLKLSIPQQHIILLHSSAEDERLNVACTALGVTQRLVKPIKMNQLFETMSRAGYTKGPGNNLKQPEKEKDAVKSGFFKVLVVDDNAFNIMLIKKIIANILPNAAIAEATNGREAVASFTSQIPDIVFMDVQMPEMNGNEATTAIRKMEINKRVPIIALTAGTLIEEKEVCMEAGMDDFVTKPFASKTINEIIDRWL
jgi:CheY-like chemotaxis protein